MSDYNLQAVPRCPKCGDRAHRIYEKIAGNDCYEVVPDPSGGFALVGVGGVGEHGGKVWAECSAGHSWTLRGVCMIEEIATLKQETQ